MTKKPKPDRDTFPDFHDRFVQREPTLRHYHARPPESPHKGVRRPETYSDSTGIRLILEQVGELNTRTYDIHGQVSSLSTAQKEIRSSLLDVQRGQQAHADKLDLLTRRVDRHSGKILSRSIKRKTLAPVEYVIKNFSTIVKIIILVIIGFLFLLGITVSITDLPKL